MHRRLHRITFILGMALSMVPGLHAFAQDDDQRSAAREAFAGMQRTGGEITAISGSTITLKTEEGATMQVVTTDNTRIMKGRGATVKVADLKVGDGVVAVGNLDAPKKTLHAAMVMATDAAQVKAMKENLGKTYIAGKVTAIDLDNVKMTVERGDHVSQTIAFDETTSFKRGGRINMGAFGGGGGPPSGAAMTTGGESITLADIKIGDNVGGSGSLKNGVFVPTQLTVATPGAGGGRRRRNEDGTPASPPVQAPQ